MKEKPRFVLFSRGSCIALLLAFAGGVLSGNDMPIPGKHSSAGLFQRQVTGTVSDASGQPLPGVSVTVRDASGMGASTDENGRYALDHVPDGAVLVFSYIGFKTIEEPVNDRTVVDAVLEPGSEEMDEVVVIGYGTMDRSKLSGSISSINSAAIEKDPLPSIAQAIQGKAGGVQVTQNSGTPGGGLSIRVRGATSINASSEPLYVVDGVPVSGNNNFVGAGGFNLGGFDQGINVLSAINPSDIASVEVLKDASATAIYGARAANGVVMITTKKGVAGQSRISVNAYAGVSEVPRERWFDMMNTEQYQDYMRDLWKYDPDGRDIPDAILANPDINTNWQEEIFRTAPIQSYEVSASGGSERTRYYSSMGYYNQQGTIINSGFNRLSARLNLDHQFNERLRFTTNFNITRAKNDRIQEENSYQAPVRYGIIAPPNLPVLDEEGNYVYDPVVGNRENPVAWLELLTNQAETYRILGNVSAQYDILEGLTFKTNLGMDVTTIEETFFQPPNGPRFMAGIGQGISKTSKDQLWLNENTLNYNNTFGDHTLDALLGFSLQGSQFKFTHAHRQNFPSNDIPTLGAGGTVYNGLSGRQEWSIASYFARLNYDFKEKLIFSANFRIDGSSRFGSDNKYGIFPSFSAAWRISEEDFFQASFMNNLKIRASWGKTGNQEIPNYASYTLYTGGANYLNGPGFLTNQLGDPGLGWESTEQYNIGLDAGFLNGRISLLADYYVKNTNDLLVQVELPRSSGYQTSYRNIGKIQNKGFEFELTTQNLTGDFSWETSLNMTFNRNKVVSLPEGELFGGIGNSSNVAMEGYPLGSFFGWEMAGVNPETGMIDYYLKDGSLGPPNDEEDRKIIGDPNPAMYGGITNNLRYKGFDLSIMGQFVTGTDVFNYTSYYRLEAFNASSNQDVAFTRRWREPGDITDVPRPTPGNFDNSAISTRWLEDASFFRIRNVTLGYTLPENTLQKLGVQRMRLYATVQNAYVFTKYTGFDPEVRAGSSQGMVYGVDHSSYPQPRIFTGGINLIF